MQGKPYESSRRDERSKMSLHQEKNEKVAQLIGLKYFYIGESLASDIRALESKEEVIRRRQGYKQRIKNIEKYRSLLDHQSSDGTMSSAILWVKDYKLEVMRTRKQIMKMNETTKSKSPGTKPNQQMFPTFSPPSVPREGQEHFSYKVAIDEEIREKAKTPMLRRQATLTSKSPKGGNPDKLQLPVILQSSRSNLKGCALLNPLESQTRSETEPVAVDDLRLHQRCIRDGPCHSK